MRNQQDQYNAHLSNALESIQQAIMKREDPYAHIQMLRDECLVRIEKPERLSASKTLFIPDSAKRSDYELYQATVLACGPGRLRKDGRLNPIEVKPGDRVLVYWAGAECQPVRCYDDTQELRIIAEWSIQAVLED